MTDDEACARAAEPQSADDRRTDEAKTLARDVGLQPRVMPPEVTAKPPATRPLSFGVFGSRPAGASRARLGKTAAVFRHNVFSLAAITIFSRTLTKAAWLVQS